MCANLRASLSRSSDANGVTRGCGAHGVRVGWVHTCKYVKMLTRTYSG
jgi:hypothetical protein